MATNLRGAGYDVVQAANGESALSTAAIRQPDAVVLDLVLPDRSGIDVCRELRTWSEVPILILSAVGEETQKVAALDAGADDYVTKPFGMDELLARLRAAMRRAVPVPDEPIRIGRLTVDLARQLVLADGEPIHLSRIEYNLLAAARAQRGQAAYPPGDPARGVGAVLPGRVALPARVYLAPPPEDRARPTAPGVPDHRAGRRLPAGGWSPGRLRTEYATGMGTGDRFTAEQPPPTDAFSRALSGIILPIALTAALVVAMYPFRQDLNTGTIALVLLLPPLLATIGGLRTAMAMAVVGALTFNFFFTEPYNSFRIETSESIAAFFIYLLVAFIVALFASRLRDHDSAAAELLARAEVLQQATVELLTAEHPRQVAEAWLERLRAELSLQAVHVTTGGRVEVTAGRNLAPEEQRLVDAYTRVVELALQRERTPLRSR